MSVFWLLKTLSVLPKQVKDSSSSDTEAMEDECQHWRLNSTVPSVPCNPPTRFSAPSLHLIRTPGALGYLYHSARGVYEEVKRAWHREVSHSIPLRMPAFFCGPLALPQICGPRGAMTRHCVLVSSEAMLEIHYGY